MTSRLSFPFLGVLFLASFIVPVLSHFEYPHLHPPNEFLSNNTNPSPFGFLKNLQGCRRGDKVNGITNLKLYLSRFGYLDYQKNANVSNTKEDSFVEELEAALKSYQVYYNLTATGMLDEPTLTKMVKPRCGFPDKETHKRIDGSLHTVSHYRFFPGRPKWPKGKRHLTYAFGSRFPTRFMRPIARAFNKWTIASRHFTFSRARTYRSADLKISFQRGNHGDGSPFDGRGGVLAHAFAPRDGRLHYDADDNWVIGAVPNGYDVETLALHEIGHLLGLGHSQIRNAIMWPTFNSGVTKGLNSDDIRGIRALYGSN